MRDKKKKLQDVNSNNYSDRNHLLFLYFHSIFICAEYAQNVIHNNEKLLKKKILQLIEKEQMQQKFKRLSF